MKDDRDNKKDSPAGVSRRNFLGTASCAAVGSTALFSTVLDLGMFNVMAQTAPGDYKALVCLFFGGGIDSFNIVVPSGPTEYAEYAQVRQDLALPQIDLLPIAPATPQGRQFGLHPNVPELQTLFANGDLAFLNNVGTLVEPMTLQQYRDGSVRRPLGLFSHSDQQMHWQTSIPDRRNASGWAGRMADVLGAVNNNQNIAMNISLSGQNTFQSGNITAHYTITENGSRGLRGYGGSSLADQVKTDSVDSLLAMTYQHLFEQTFADRMRGAIDAHLEFSAAIAALPPLQTVFSQTRLSQEFRMVAQTIQARQTLGMRRQTFFISMGGWDHHDEVLVNQENMLPIVSAALSEFNAAMVELGVQNDVTTFTASDFGRTLTSNGRGSDHAWGGNHMIMGGAVRGADFYGQYPSLYLGNSQDTGRGRLIPTTSTDEYFAELALWFGVARQDLEIVLPNIRRFYDPASPTTPLGIISPATQPVYGPVYPRGGNITGGARPDRAGPRGRRR
ncbi:MAG: DUF1501 domain-containing protein [Acidobacteria bacterium]|nr:DUF1501 domain-containing protein [Acidobacteriota bacterium]NIM60119.1 DUF1501 domain-containing protein [Acidobacteriota bacterium]NIO57788.1 DUF1501 domain-containing protein [Acidobacteriota bacterium]NIQ28797.1 DUF1501 domain-containing protein [Acidobacteriota bacterium]NIQ83255.1 DUF1501 domain-containing protein [Acidobacteriota bacterium]